MVQGVKATVGPAGNGGIASVDETVGEQEGPHAQCFGYHILACIIAHHGALFSNAPGLLQDFLVIGEAGLAAGGVFVGGVIVYAPVRIAAAAVEGDLVFPRTDLGEAPLLSDTSQNVKKLADAFGFCIS